MIKQKFKKQFTDTELNAYLTSISTITGGQSAQVDEAWRTLGYINASAFKGYGSISDDHAIYNGKVYRTKEQAIITLAQHTSNIVAFGGVLYIRTLNGIQISFHLGSILNHSDALNNIHRQYQGRAEWDGVASSYTYTDIKAYNDARADYQRKRQEDADKKQQNNAILHQAIQEYFKHHMTRKSFGLPTKKNEWQAACEKAVAEYRNTDIEFALAAYGVKQWNGGWDQRSYLSYDIRRKNLPSNWDEMNTYNFND